ncbi:hypothetical protein [Xanthomonas prunicola]|uniref:hypothetical protein n=1 Tax=Xanthomonas TaxID=338 RepID=UPI0021B4CA0A|nr:hypothetical protein [Xanthomonas prunicola]UXA53338.1 hypothetical protein M0D45_00595 [Xanthomonas prunicola]
MHAMLIAIAAALLGVAIPAAAGERSQLGRTTDLYQETSYAGETLDAFVTRIAARARAASVSARAVVCGQIQGAGPYTLALKTDGRQDWCEVPKTVAPYVLVNGIAKDAREDHIPAIYARRAGYLITPWSTKFQDRIASRKIGSASR